MIRFLADEDFNGRIVRGVFLRKSALQLVRAQDIVDLKGADDSHILRWAWDNQRALLTHDARTLPRHVRDHLHSGLHTFGVFIVDDWARIGACVDDILLIAECSEDDEWQDTIIYLPFERS